MAVRKGAEWHRERPTKGEERPSTVAVERNGEKVKCVRENEEHEEQKRVRVVPSVCVREITNRRYWKMKKGLRSGSDGEWMGMMSQP
jgi:hypothetical protein